MNLEKDEYFIKALKEGYRARSSYKLIQLAQCFNIFKDAKNVIDLCAAPGSWSQVISNRLHHRTNITESDKMKLNPDVKIVAVDFAPIKPIPGVTSLVADITSITTYKKLRDLFQNEKVDLIVCDGAHDVSGMVQADFQLHLGLITACIHLVLQMLRDNGIFIAKLFNTWGCQIFLSQLRIFFKEVHIVKPHSSRQESYECFAVCMKYMKPKDFDPSQLTPYLNYTYRDFSSLTGIHKLYIPLLVVGHYDITSNEFEELQKEYGGDLCIENDPIEELFMENDFSKFKKSLEETDENTKFLNKVLNKNRVSFGTSEKPLIIHLNKDNKIDYSKTMDGKLLNLEANWISNGETLVSEDKDAHHIAKLFEGFTLEETKQNSETEHKDPKFIESLFEGFTLEETEEKPPEESHPWFSENNLEKSNQEFEDFDLEPIMEKTENEIMKVIRENDGSVPDNLDLSDKFSILENSNGDVLKLVKERRDVLEEIQRIVKENKF